MCREKSVINEPLASVAKKLRADFPNAIVIQEPLTFCSSSPGGDVGACLPNMYQDFYIASISKTGLRSPSLN
jgi:hypothetical protein